MSGYMVKQTHKSALNNRVCKTRRVYVRMYFATTRFHYRDYTLLMCRDKKGELQTGQYRFRRPCDIDRCDRR